MWQQRGRQILEQLTKHGWRLAWEGSGAGTGNDLDASAAARPKRTAFLQAGLRMGSPRPPGEIGTPRLLFPAIALMVLLDVSTEQGSSNAFEEAPKEVMTKNG